MENSQELPRSKKILFSLILLFVVLLAIEVLAQFTFKAIYDYSHRPNKLHRLTSSSWVFNQNEVGVPNHLSDLIIHPYFGFAINSQPGVKNQLGFGQSKSAIDSVKQKDKLRVLLLGGSVAVQLALPNGEDRQSYLERALRTALKSHGLHDDVWMMSAALPGFKQPQQFFAYSYLMTQGAEFDLVINVDGFNEMTLAMLEGRPKGLYPTYPRGWDVLLGNQVTAAKLRQVGQLLKVRDEQASMLERAQSSALARSAIVGLLLAHKITSNERIASELVGEIEHRELAGTLSFEAGGLPFNYENEPHAYEFLANLWSNSSKQLAQLVSSNSASYLQVFQPNQYLYESKPLSELELKKFYAPDQGFGKVYNAAYPYFNSHIVKMKNSDDWFVDGSMVFKTESDTVYSDVCCHFNEHGLELLADFIASKVISATDISSTHLKNSE